MKCAKTLSAVVLGLMVVVLVLLSAHVRVSAGFGDVGEGLASLGDGAARGTDDDAGGIDWPADTGDEPVFPTRNIDSGPTPTEVPATDIDYTPHAADDSAANGGSDCSSSRRLAARKLPNIHITCSMDSPPPSEYTKQEPDAPEPRQDPRDDDRAEPSPVSSCCSTIYLLCRRATLPLLLFSSLLQQLMCLFSTGAQ